MFMFPLKKLACKGLTLNPLWGLAFQEVEKDECFKVDLLECSAGAKFGRIRKTIITIVNDDGEWAW